MESDVVHHRSLLVLCSVISLVVGGVIGFSAPRARSQPITIATPDPTVTPWPTPTPGPLRVYVSGAVAAPAVYRLPPGSLAEDALRAAGGPASGADLDRINLAQELLDQQQVYVPYEEDEGRQPPFSGGVSATDEALIDINTAGAEELAALPNIGPATAQAIVEYREIHGLFATIEGILEVPGVGPATFEEIRGRITVGDV